MASARRESDAGSYQEVWEKIRTALLGEGEPNWCAATSDLSASHVECAEGAGACRAKMRRVDLVSALKSNGVYTQQDVRGTCGTRLKKTKEMMGADLAALIAEGRLLTPGEAARQNTM